MLALSFLSLAILSIAKATSDSDVCDTLWLLDISNPETNAALDNMIDNSPGHTYIKPD